MSSPGIEIALNVNLLVFVAWVYLGTYSNGEIVLVLSLFLLKYF